MDGDLVEQFFVFYAEGGYDSTSPGTETQPQDAEISSSVYGGGDVLVGDSHDIIGAVEGLLVTDDGVSSIPIPRFVVGELGEWPLV